MTPRSVTIPESYVGPPTMGHGGYVAGVVAAGLGGGRQGAVQVTLRAPTPVGTSLDLVVEDDRATLCDGDTLIAEAVRATLDLDVPPMPMPAAARVAEAGSPSHWNDRGVHPICLGCGLARDDDDGLRIAVGPLTVDGNDQVADVWRPRSFHAGADDATADPLWVLAALDCPGAMAYIAREVRVGLLGRIVFEQFAPVTLGDDHVVAGWQIGIDGRKHFAGTALAAADGTVLAAAHATWFSFG